MFPLDDEEKSLHDPSYNGRSRAAFQENTLYRPTVPWPHPGLSERAAKEQTAQQAPIIPDDHTTTYTKGIPVDPDTMPAGQSQWHLVDTWGLHADLVWPNYTGSGVMVGVLDDGFQYGHWDISPNYRTDLDRDVPNSDNDPAPFYSGDNHGTSVIGTIIADDNGLGGVGVAFDAQAYGIRLDFGGGGTIAHTITGFQYAGSTGADVLNNSWGYTTQFADTTNINFGGQDFIDIINEFQNLTEDGRGGLGTNIVFAAGNSRTSGDNVNYHNMQNSEYVITVAAIDSDGTYSYFSTPGAAVLVAAGGTSVWVPDRTGANGYDGGDYVDFSGTSAAAPIVTGAVAVILEANADLGWRDVQEILAYSAQHNDAAGGSWQYNGAMNWNGAGLHFSHDYGFGAVDLYRAVRLAETWELQQTSANWSTLSPVTNSSSVAIPATGTITSTINISQDVEIERVLINLNIAHARAGDLVVTLISPDGTESVLIDHPENGAFTGIYSFSGINFETTSNAHWGESSLGTWTLEVQDTVGGNAGTLSNWSLSFTGNSQSADDQYVYTSDFGAFTGAEYTTRSTLTDAGGTDTINLSTISTNTTLDMNGGVASTVAAKTLTIAPGTVIEKAYLGDGNDNVTGNSANNTIDTGRGNDTIIGSAGDDTINGGAGTDTMSYLETVANFTFNFINSLTVAITHIGTVWTDTVTAIENFLFTSGSYTFAQLQAYAISGPSSTINGTGSNDSLNGDSINNTINGQAGNDRIYGRAGNDTLNGDDGADSMWGDIGNDTINGGNDADILSGEDGNDIISGDAGNDILNGGEGNDTISGGTGDDTIYGGNGTDTVLYSVNSTGFIVYRDSSLSLTVYDTNGVYGTDKIDNNIETIQFNDTSINLLTTIFTVNGAGWGSTAAVNGTGGADTMNGTLSNDTLNGNGGNDRLYGKAGDDTLSGNDGDDLLSGEAGNDTINGGNGNDTLYGGDGNDTINAGLGNNTVDGGNGTDTAVYSVNSTGFMVYRDNAAYIRVVDTNGIYGSDMILNNVETIQFNDTSINLLITTFTINGSAWGNAVAVTGTAGADTLNGMSGNDTISGGNGNDKIYGKAGDDTLNGDDGDDNIWGDAGNDTINGGNGIDSLVGGDGNDAITGESGNDILNGGEGNDTLSAGIGNDTMYGGNGTDIALYSANGSGFIIYRDNTSYLTIVDTNGVYGTDTIDNTVETIQFNDTSINLLTTIFSVNGAGWGSAAAVNGTGGADTLNGTLSSDTLSGNAGNDKLYGKAGDDYLNGGDGGDLLSGEAGNDTVKGGSGNDLLYGGAGTDQFVFSNLGSGTDTVGDYQLNEKLNITDLLTGFDDGVDDISLFLQATHFSNHTKFYVNADGIGTDFAHAFTVEGVLLSGQTAQNLLDSATLVTDTSIA